MAASICHLSLRLFSTNSFVRGRPVRQLIRAAGPKFSFNLVPLYHKKLGLVFKTCQPGLVFRSILLSAVGFTTDAAAQKVSSSKSNIDSDSKKTFEPNDPRLRSSECLKNAAGLSVDSTSAVLSQTVYALTKIEHEYVELVNVLILLMEYQLQVVGHTAEEDRIGDLIVETRHEISKVKQRKEDLQLLFASAEKLADATAEVAFAAGAEYASTSAGERLYSAQREVRRVQGKSEEAERRLAEAQARTIEKLSRLEEKLQQAEMEAADTAQQEIDSAATVEGNHAGSAANSDKAARDSTERRGDVDDLSKG